RAAAVLVGAALLVSVSGLLAFSGGRPAPPGEGLGGMPLAGLPGGAAAQVATEPPKEPPGSIPMAVIQLEGDYYLGQLEQLLSAQSTARGTLRGARRIKDEMTLKDAEAELKELALEIEEVKKKLTALEQERSKIVGPTKTPFRRDPLIEFGAPGGI
ncbi:MAG: hypothetical protein ACRC33_17195, partial [Gemmataceae bacterium]